MIAAKVRLRILKRIWLWLITLSVGGLWIVGYLVVPVIFKSIADRQLAGAIASQLFLTINWIVAGSAVYGLIMVKLVEFNADHSRLLIRLLGSSLALSSLFLLLVQPSMENLKKMAQPMDVMNSAYADTFALWHGFSSVMYLLVSAVGAVLIVKINTSLNLDA